MSYVRLSHTVLDDDKVQRLSADAWWLYTHVILWCSQNGTGGFVRPVNLRGLAHEDSGDVGATAEELVAAGLLYRDGRGYRVRDYLRC